MRALRIGLVALLLCAPARAAETPVLDAVLAGFGRVRHVEARYVERRFLAVLRAPLETRGTLRFDAPDRLEKTGDPETGERIVVAGGAMTVERGPGVPPLKLALREHPEIGALVESVRAMLAGDAVSLRRDFDVDVAGDVAHWQIVLRPHRDDLVRWVRLDGEAARITRIETREADGDRSEMTIEPAR